MTIFAMVNAEKEGQIESKMMKARQLEEIRESKKKEADARQSEKKSKLVWKSADYQIIHTDLHRKMQRSRFARIARAKATLLKAASQIKLPKIVQSQSRVERRRAWHLLEIIPTKVILCIALSVFGSGRSMGLSIFKRDIIDNLTTIAIASQSASTFYITNSLGLNESVDDRQVEFSLNRAKVPSAGFYAGILLVREGLSVHQFRLFNDRRRFEINLIGHHVQEVGHLSD